MTNKKKLKENPEYNINLVEVAEVLLKNKKTKYIELFLRLLIDKVSNNKFRCYEHDKHLDLIRDHFNLVKYRILEPLIAEREIEQMINCVNEYAEYNERGLIENNDITSIKDMTDIQNELSKSFIRRNNSDLKRQVKEYYRDDEWIIVQPISFLSSVLYGSGTKWCTAMRDNASYFFRYSCDGMLIYCINTKTNEKYGIFKSESQGTSVWNKVDDRIDIIDTTMPLKIIGRIREILNDNFIRNVELRDDTIKDTHYDEWYGNGGKYYNSDTEITVDAGMPEHVNAPLRIHQDVLDEYSESEDAINLEDEA